MLRNFGLKASLLVVMVALCLGVLIANAEGAVLSWTSPTTANLGSVYMVGADDGWAVGSDGTIIRWDGTEWSNVTSPTTKTLYSVFMVGADDGWAVGDYGTIIHWTGTEWIPEFPAAILMPLLISVTLVAVILAKTASKKRRRPSLPSKTLLYR